MNWSSVPRKAHPPFKKITKPTNVVRNARALLSQGDYLTIHTWAMLGHGSGKNILINEMAPLNAKNWQMTLNGKLSIN